MSNRDVLKEIKSQHRLLAILRILQKMNGYAANLSLLKDLLAEYALAGSSDEIRGELIRLEEIGAIKLENVNGLIIATLTERGDELGNGLIQSEEILRPGPECAY